MLRLFTMALVSSLTSCLISTETVPGPKGDKGDPGSAGASADPSELAALQATIDALQARVDALEKRNADPECPHGYALSINPQREDVVRCVLGPDGNESDEVVRVGSGATAFWIDRFEASLWYDQAGTQGVGDIPATFKGSAQVTSKANLLFAKSHKGVQARIVTWFQAQAACAASGKRLPTDEEWTLAAMGTPDPAQPSAGDGGTCLTDAAAPRVTGADGAAINCASLWGAEDMIGNVQEFTATWYAGANGPGGPQTTWPAGYGDDATWNVSTVLANVSSLPAASLRGGYFQLGTGAGVFSMFLLSAPSENGGVGGFRCTIPR